MHDIFHPNSEIMPGIQGQSAFAINSQGMRGREFGSDDAEYRILAIGGSTTECAYLDGQESWPSILEGTLGKTADNRSVWVGNVGKSGRKSRGHYVQLKYLIPQHKKTDAVIMLVGVNDFASSLKQGDQYVLPDLITTPDAQLEQIKSAFMISPGKLHETAARENIWFKRTAMWQLIKRAKYAVYSMTSLHLAQDTSGKNLVEWRKAKRNAPKILYWSSPTGHFL